MSPRNHWLRVAAWSSVRIARFRAEGHVYRTHYPMPMLPYALARPLLFRLDPEKAHELTLAALAATQRTPLARAYSAALVSDPTTVAGLRFANRVGLAAGMDKNARCIDAFGAMGFGFVEVGTVTPLAQAGNPRPRVFRLPAAGALVNRLGFNNDGLNAFIENVKRSSFRSTGRLLGLNIGKNGATPIERAAEDYLTCLDGVYPHADYVTVNISSPNTAGLRALQHDTALDALLGQIGERRELLAQRYERRVPIFVKIAPDLDDAQLAAIAALLQRYGANGGGFGVVATNTTLTRDAVQDEPHANESGGLSGRPLQALGDRVVSGLRAALGPEFPIIGVGGIDSAASALKKIEAGADLLQIYSGLIYRGPTLVGEIARALAGRTGHTPH